MTYVVRSPASMTVGVFSWKRRMGVHEAYHQHMGNRWVHWLCIPFELWSVVKLTSVLTLVQVDLSLVLVAMLTPVYMATEIFLGARMIAFLLLLRATALAFLPQHAALASGIALAVFTVAFTLQVVLGHGVLEQGRDDTKVNIAELRRTKNPVPIVLIFYYHLVEVAFHAGYRPALRRHVDRFTRTELARICTRVDSD